MPLIIIYRVTWVLSGNLTNETVDIKCKVNLF